MALTPKLLAALIAVASACGLAAGVAWIYPPAGLIAASLEGMFAAYAIAYLDTNRGKGAR